MRKDKMLIKKFATNTIKINIVRDYLKTLLDEIPAGTIKEKWNAFKLIMYKVSNEKLCTVVRKHEDCFNRNSLEREELINNRNLARFNMLSKKTVCYMEYTVNFSKRDAENSKINGG